MRAAPARATSLAAGIAGAFLLASGLAATSAAAQYHGAIGYSPATGAMGWSFDYPSRDEARKVAAARCAEHATDCKIVVDFKDGCGVVAEGAQAQTSAASPSRSAAQARAMRRCRSVSEGCVVRRWVCTTRSMY